MTGWGKASKLVVETLSAPEIHSTKDVVQVHGYKFKGPVFFLWIASSLVCEIWY